MDFFGQMIGRNNEAGKSLKKGPVKRGQGEGGLKQQS